MMKTQKHYYNNVEPETYNDDDIEILLLNNDEPDDINDVLLRSIVIPDTVNDEFMVVILFNIVNPLMYNNPLIETLFDNDKLDTDNDDDIETLLFNIYDIPETVNDEFME